jgi:Ca2+-binding EF-hand superfamily protein
MSLTIKVKEFINKTSEVWRSLAFDTTEIPDYIVGEQRTQYWIQYLSLSTDDIRVLYRTYSQFMSEDNTLTVEKFYTDILRSERNPATDQMIAMMDLSNGTVFTFGEYVDFLCRYCMFEVSDTLIMVFNFFKNEESGRAEFDEFRKFCQVMLGNGAKSNMETGLLSMKLDNSGRFTFDELVTLNRRFPHVLYPVFRIKIELERLSFGERWWERAIWRVKDSEALRQAAERGDAAARLKKAQIKQDREILERMGWWRYNFMPWERSKTRARLAKIAAMDAEAEAIVDAAMKQSTYQSFSYTSKPAVPQKQTGAYEIER